MAEGSVRARRLGRLSAEERAARLCDPGTFAREAGALAARGAETPPGDGLVAGVGLVNGRPVSVIATDGRILRGALGEAGAMTATRLVSDARDAGRPVVLLLDSDGARQSEGVPAVNANARLLATLADVGGYVPRLAAVFGAAGGSAAYALALSDLAVALADRSFAFVAGPAVVERALGESCSLDALGGTRLHGTTGLLHASVSDDTEALAWLRSALGFLPGAAWSAPPPGDPAEDAATPIGAADELIPFDGRRAWDHRRAVEGIVDGGSWLELGAPWGSSIRTGLARLAGRALLLVVSSPSDRAGALDAAASRKLTRFVRFAAAFGLPILTLADTPGFLPGQRSERESVLCHGAAVIAAYAEAKRHVPRVSVVLRRAIGAGSVLAAEADIVLALPDATVAQMGAEALEAASRAAGIEHQSMVVPSPEAAGFAHRTIAAHALRAELIRAFERLPAARAIAAGTRRTPLIPS